MTPDEQVAYEAMREERDRLLECQTAMIQSNAANYDGRVAAEATVARLREKMEAQRMAYNAVEDVAREQGYDPEGAEAMGYKECSLPDYFRRKLAQLKAALSASPTGENSSKITTTI